MKKNYIPVFGFLAILFFSCGEESPKSDKNKPTTFVNYYLRYLEPEQQFKAEATFSAGDSLAVAKPIKIENGVFFHGGNLDERDLGKYGIRYIGIREGGFSDNLVFRYTDPLHGKLSQNFHINSMENFSVKQIEQGSENHVSKSKGMTIIWEGEPLQPDETLVFLFNSEKNKLKSFEIKGATSGAEVEVPAQKLSPLEEGKAELYLVRKQSAIDQQPNLVVMTEMEYYTRVINVTILP